jgi:hypothetical protein
MTRDAEIVLAGFVKLSEADQKEVAEAIERFRRSDRPTQKSTGELWEKRGRDRILMGPVASGCPCCGR